MPYKATRFRASLANYKGILRALNLGMSPSIIADINAGASWMREILLTFRNCTHASET